MRKEAWFWNKVRILKDWKADTPRKYSVMALADFLWKSHGWCMQYLSPTTPRSWATAQARNNDLQTCCPPAHPLSTSRSVSALCQPLSHSLLNYSSHWSLHSRSYHLNWAPLVLSNPTFLVTTHPCPLRLALASFNTRSTNKAISSVWGSVLYISNA